VRLLGFGPLEKRLEIAHLKGHVLVVGHATHDLAHQQRLAVAVDGAHLLRRLSLPLGAIRSGVRAVGLVLGAGAPIAHHAHFDDVEEQLAAIVANLGQFRVEIERRHWRRNANGRGSAHLHEWHNDLVEDSQIHVGGLPARARVSNVDGGWQ